MRSGTRLTLALILVLALAACGGRLPHGLEETRLSFEGSVTSAVDGAPIQGATVEFFSSSFGGPLTHGTTVTDAAGRYALTVRFTCGPSSTNALLFEHLSAIAPGFAGSSTAPSSLFCTTDTRTIDFALRPF